MGCGVHSEEQKILLGRVCLFASKLLTRTKCVSFKTLQCSTLQHDDREGEAGVKCTENRGRGGFTRGRARFIVRKATSGPSTAGSKWAQEKFGINAAHGAERETDMEQDHRNEREAAGEHS